VTNTSQCAHRGIDADARPVNPCGWCQHFEFIHAHSGLCLFSQCTCPFFVPGPGQTGDASGDAG